MRMMNMYNIVEACWILERTTHLLQGCVLEGLILKVGIKKNQLKLEKRR
jgi:hypothetical protein